MALRDGKRDACQILRIPFKDRKELICEKKESEILVFEIKLVEEMDKPKTAIKMCSKLTFFTCRSVR